MAKNRIATIYFTRSQHHAVKQILNIVDHGGRLNLRKITPSFAYNYLIIYYYSTNTLNE